MRKTMIILLAVLAVIMLASCSVDKGNSEENTLSQNTNQDLEALFQIVCSADDALEFARKSNIPVHFGFFVSGFIAVLEILSSHQSLN